MKREPRKPRSKKLIFLYLMLLVCFIAELLFYTWCRVQSVQLRFDITKQTSQHQNLVELQKNLKIELARLKSPRRIAEFARTRLGLITPTPQQTIVIP